MAFLAKEECLVFGKATLHSLRETSQEVMEPIGNQSKNKKWLWEYSKINMYRDQVGRGGVELFDSTLLVNRTWARHWSIIRLWGCNSLAMWPGFIPFGHVPVES